MSPLRPPDILWIASSLVELGLIYKISSGPLRNSFPYFRLFLVASVLCTPALAYVRYILKDRNLYGEGFIAWSYVSSLFYFLILLEASSGSLARFPAIARASRTALLTFWGLIGVVGLAWYYYLTHLPSGKFPALYTAMRYQDSACLGFTLYIFLFLAFVSWMPVPLSHNRLTHAFLVGCLFLFLALARIVPELGSYAGHRDLASYVGMGGSILVYSVWMAKIRQIDGSLLQTPKGSVNREEAEVMLARLDELNTTMGRAGPRLIR